MKKPYIIGYCTGRGLNLMTRESAMRLTHVNTAFGHVSDGLLTLRGLPDLKAQVENLRQLNPDLKVVLSVGGWTAGGFSIMSRTEAGRQAFAASVKDAVLSCGLDGIDIDWEYPCNDAAGIDCDPSDRFNFTYLLSALRDAVGPDRIVSIAAGAGDYFVRDTEMEKVGQICDYVQLMTYDMNVFDHTTLHHTALFDPLHRDREGTGDHAVRIFHEAGVPLNKLAIGAAFYSRLWKGVKDENQGLMQEAETIGQYGPGWEDFQKNYVGKDGFVSYWDDNAKAPWLFNGSTFITYDDARSIREKCRYVREKGLFGLMYWGHSCDPSGYLLKNMAEAMWGENEA